MKSTDIKPRELCALVHGIIKDNPERHDQMIYTSLATLRPVGTVRRYAVKPMRPGAAAYKDSVYLPLCDTTACVAGWAAVMSAPVSWQIDDQVLVSGKGTDHERDRGDIEDYAQLRLGLTNRQAFWLFQALRSRSEILWALDYLANNPDPDYPDKPDQEIDLHGAYAAHAPSGSRARAAR